MIHWIGFPLTFVLALLLAKLRTIAKYLVTPRTHTLKSAAEVRNLLNPPDTSLLDMLRARAAPNQRLVNAFGLTNTFVSPDPKVHRAFTAEAKALLSSARMKGSGWDALAHTANEIIRQYLPDQQNVEFATFIQCITFSIVLSSLFGANPETLHHDDVVYVTKIINKRWTDSKTKDPTLMRQDDSLQRITDLIDGWISERDQYPNPLNLILPAYETTWRVVAVAIAYIYCYSDSTLRDVMIAFGRNPTEDQFKCFEDDSLCSAQAIVLEVLRLHPPTRHIARASTESATRWWHRLFKFIPATTFIADIEAVHRSEEEFGENAEEFDPMRFHPSRMEGGRAELFAFGYGKLGCVAAAWAPMAAAVIVGKVIEEIEGSGVTVTPGEKIGGRNGWDGWMVAREA